MYIYDVKIWFSDEVRCYRYYDLICPKDMDPSNTLRIGELILKKCIFAGEV